MKSTLDCLKVFFVNLVAKKVCAFWQNWIAKIASVIFFINFYQWSHIRYVITYYESCTWTWIAWIRGTRVVMWTKSVKFWLIFPGISAIAKFKNSGKKHLDLNGLFRVKFWQQSGHYITAEKSLRERKSRHMESSYLQPMSLEICFNLLNFLKSFLLNRCLNEELLKWHRLPHDSSFYQSCIKPLKGKQDFPHRTKIYKTKHC